ncbi:GNAT family N-acetyltransferase [Eubacteriales bacterium OttesenSCG-928-K08]|nr:GNAT family N-acetyltransferase [Eubacteriales bacterium OttesenSCG-928-K08]
MLRQLSLKEIEKLYKERISEDFPRMERRPLFTIRKMYREGRYVCLALEEDKTIAAYATFICDNEISSVLLDFYAVDKSKRGSGIGSRFLPMLAEFWALKQGIILECERPSKAKNEKEKNTRERRISFYERNGAQMTPLSWQAFGVDYNVLWLPVKATFDKSTPGKDLLDLYLLSVPRFLKNICFKIDLPDV